MGVCRECLAAYELKAEYRGYKNCPECGRNVENKPQSGQEKEGK